MIVLLAGLLLGVAGSVHCLGMCGPLALMARRESFARPPELTHVVRSPSAASSGADLRRPGADFLAYHTARIGVYLVLGAMAGLTGDALAGFGWRNGLTIAAGIALVAQGFGALARLFGPRPARVIAALSARLGAAACVLPSNGVARQAAFGALNGLLPCGLLYAALAAAAGLGDVRDALTFVAAFGVGTLPMFAALVVSARIILPRAPHWLRQAAPLALAIVGLLLIARGLPGDVPHAHHVHAEAVHAIDHP